MSLLRCLALILALLALPLTSAAEPLVLDASAMRRLADEAITAGFAEDALAIADTLLLRDPQDATALILRARALRLLGRHAEAVASASAAWAASNSDGGRYGAAMIMAQALSFQGRRIEAQLWLRRAAEHAPSDRARALARQDFDYVRATTPLKLSFALSVKPSSNVNNGSRDTTFAFFDNGICQLGCIGDLSGGALALSGLEGAVGFNAEYRLHDSLTAQGMAAVSFSHGFVVLSDEAKAIAPTAKADDFALTSVDFGLTESRYRTQTGQLWRLGLHGGSTWYGGAHLSDYVLGSLSTKAQLLPRWQVQGELTLQRQFPDAVNAANSDLAEVEITATTRTAAGNSLSFGLSSGQTFSNNPYNENNRLGLSFGWQKAAPIGGMRLSARLDLASTAFPLSVYNPAGRDDLGISASVSAQLDKLDYMGFVPVVTLEAGRTWSSVGLYNSDSLGLGLGIASKF